MYILYSRHHYLINFILIKLMNRTNPNLNYLYLNTDDPFLIQQ
jgi:hypothetical protein